MAESRTCPLMRDGKGTGLNVLWEDAEVAWKTYSDKAGGSDQPLERLVERGGFSVEEFVYFFNGMGFSEAQNHRWKVQQCSNCSGRGWFPDSTDGGVPRRCGVCMGAGSVLPDGVKP